MNEYSCLIQTLLLNKGRPCNRYRFASDVVTAIRQHFYYLAEIGLIFILSLLCVMCLWFITQMANKVMHHLYTQKNLDNTFCCEPYVFMHSSVHVCMCVIVCGTDGGVKDSEGCSDHILSADAASWYWNLAGDLKLFTHFPWNPPVFVCVCE